MSWVDRHLQSEYRARAADEAARRAYHERRREKERKEAREERLEDIESGAVAALQQAMLFEEMETRLDALEVEVTQALILNDQKLDRVNERLGNIMEMAVVLPDGRRIFKTEDGTQVFDEVGAEIPPDLVDPASIPDERPSWETYQETLAERDALLAERERLHKLQDDIDAARDDLANGTLASDELDALEAEFGALESETAAAEPEVVQPESTSDMQRQIATDGKPVLQP